MPVRPVVTLGFLVAVLMFSATGLLAQGQTGSIAGVVRDTSGAVLPGVTVEASSPALIEKSRTVVTDGQGRYTIVDLRPGTYSVAFTLPGFATVRREGIELTSSIADAAAVTQTSESDGDFGVPGQHGATEKTEGVSAALIDRESRHCRLRASWPRC